MFQIVFGIEKAVYIPSALMPDHQRLSISQVAHHGNDASGKKQDFGVASLFPWAPQDESFLQLPSLNDSRKFEALPRPRPFSVPDSPYSIAVCLGPEKRSLMATLASIGGEVGSRKGLTVMQSVGTARVRERDPYTALAVPSHVRDRLKFRFSLEK